MSRPQGSSLKTSNGRGLDGEGDRMRGNSNQRNIAYRSAGETSKKELGRNEVEK